MDFEGGDPSSHRVSLFAYDDLLRDLRACLAAVEADRGLAPIFMCSSGRARQNELQLAALSGEAGLEVDAHRSTMVFLVVEAQEALAYEKLLPPPNQAAAAAAASSASAAAAASAAPLPAAQPGLTTVLVVIPGKHRGVRFARSCVLYLAQCLRKELHSAHAHTPSAPFDMLNMLDDDWQTPRFYDRHLNLGEDEMRPCTLYMCIYFQQHALMYEVREQDKTGRQLVLTQSRKEQEKISPQLVALLKRADEALKVRDEDEADPFQSVIKLRSFFTDQQKVRQLVSDTDRGDMPAELAALTRDVPGFNADFMQCMQQLRKHAVTVCQVASTSSDITRLRNYNLTAAAAAEQDANSAAAGESRTLPRPSSPATGTSGGAAAHAASASASASAAGASAGHQSTDARLHPAAPAPASTESTIIMMKRVCWSLWGSVTHFLPAYELRSVNYLSSADFFQPQHTVDSRLSNLWPHLGQFTDDSEFLRKVLGERGLFGFSVFKCDIAFAKRTQGGIHYFLGKDKQQRPHGAKNTFGARARKSAGIGQGAAAKKAAKAAASSAPANRRKRKREAAQDAEDADADASAAAAAASGSASHKAARVSLTRVAKSAGKVLISQAAVADGDDRDFQDDDDEDDEDGSSADQSDEEGSASAADTGSADGDGPQPMDTSSDDDEGDDDDEEVDGIILAAADEESEESDPDY
jgi:hypothetical protein